MKPTATTLGALKESGYRHRSVRDELRDNLTKALAAGRATIPGIIGYEETVIPQVFNAILSRHDVLLLGLRGQAKSRLLRSLTAFLDEWSPSLAGTALHEDPLAPLTSAGEDVIDKAGDDAPVVWRHRDERYHDKLATPDVTMADLIGDIDPIRASRERLDLSDERVIHFGLIPRSNRGIFCLNEIPDLQARIQVGLLNILEEKDVQLRGFPLRLPLDVFMVFTANPEDYTNRGSIITPLKDRIGSQIITHYPHSMEDALAITEQEADVSRTRDVPVPHFLKEIIEEIAIQARGSEHVDQASGVSARLTISAMELLVSNVERRALVSKSNTAPRLSDVFALVPAVTGKVELVYEGEQEGATIVAERLIGSAVRTTFRRSFPLIHRDKRRGQPALESQQDEPLYNRVQAWFASGNTVDVTDRRTDEEEHAALAKVDGLQELAAKYMKPTGAAEEVAAMQFVLEGMHQHSMLAREGLVGQAQYGDMISRLMQDL